MSSVSAGHDLLRTARVPREVLAQATARLWATSATSRFHRSGDCRHVRGHYHRLSPVVVTAAQLTASRACACLGIVPPPAFATVLDPVRTLADLRQATALLAAALAEPGPVHLDLDTVARQRAHRAAGEQAAAALDQALADAPAGAREAAATWAGATLARAGEVAEQVRATLAADPGRAVRAAAVTLLPELRLLHAAKVCPALSEQASPRANHRLYAAADGALRRGLTAGADTPAVLAAVAAVVAEAHPEALEQLPTHAVLPAGMPLGEAITAAWRRAATDQLTALAEVRVQQYHEHAADTAPVLLMSSQELTGPGCGLLLGLTDTIAEGPYQTRRHLYLVPAVIGAALSARQRSWVQHPGAPLPQGLRVDPYETEAARAVLTGPYATTLCRLMGELGPEEAVLAATAVAAPAG